MGAFAEGGLRAPRRDGSASGMRLARSGGRLARRHARPRLCCGSALAATAALLLPVASAYVAALERSAAATLGANAGVADPAPGGSSADDVIVASGKDLSGVDIDSLLAKATADAALLAGKAEAAEGVAPAMDSASERHGHHHGHGRHHQRREPERQNASAAVNEGSPPSPGDKGKHAPAVSAPSRGALVRREAHAHAQVPSVEERKQYSYESPNGYVRIPAALGCKRVNGEHIGMLAAAGVNGTYCNTTNLRECDLTVALQCLSDVHCWGFAVRHASVPYRLELYTAKAQDVSVQGCSRDGLLPNLDWTTYRREWYCPATSESVLFSPMRCLPDGMVQCMSNDGQSCYWVDAMDKCTRAATDTAHHMGLVMTGCPGWNNACASMKCGEGYDFNASDFADEDKPKKKRNNTNYPGPKFVTRNLTINGRNVTGHYVSDCQKCAQLFSQQGGCELLVQGQELNESIVPPECTPCGQEVSTICGRSVGPPEKTEGKSGASLIEQHLAAVASPSAAPPPAAPAPAVPVDCSQCVYVKDWGYTSEPKKVLTSKSKEAEGGNRTLAEHFKVGCTDLWRGSREGGNVSASCADCESDIYSRCMAQVEDWRRIWNNAIFLRKGGPEDLYVKFEVQGNETNGSISCHLFNYTGVSERRAQSEQLVMGEGTYGGNTAMMMFPKVAVAFAKVILEKNGTYVKWASEKWIRPYTPEGPGDKDKCYACLKDFNKFNGCAVMAAGNEPNIDMDCEPCRAVMEGSCVPVIANNSDNRTYVKYMLGNGSSKNVSDVDTNDLNRLPDEQEAMLAGPEAKLAAALLCLGAIGGLWLYNKKKQAALKDKEQKEWEDAQAREAKRQKFKEEVEEKEEKSKKAAEGAGASAAAEAADAAAPAASSG
eukprot:TRINITY_DN5288_c0_g1_i1.p1 TRINITY_DN5288_c0_g1~~TRINITY_DN5288_c0_g1_i1.p1  ORF type:complete len:885 (+),score=217.15 TRINITY_DN5288_c0_g1_i1:64-2718(+)